VPRDTRLLVISIGKADGKMIFNPPAETEVSGGDVLIVMGEQKSLRTMEKILAG
jgi:voltage-gated potassium channel